MATRITTSVGSTENPGASIAVEVAEDFDRVMDLIIPLQQPSSALEARTNNLLHDTNGKRVFIDRGAICIVEEL